MFTVEITYSDLLNDDNLRKKLSIRQNIDCLVMVNMEKVLCEESDPFIKLLMPHQPRRVEFHFTSFNAIAIMLRNVAIQSVLSHVRQLCIRLAEFTLSFDPFLSEIQPQRFPNLEDILIDFARYEWYFPRYEWYFAFRDFANLQHDKWILERLKFSSIQWSPHTMQCLQMITSPERMVVPSWYIIAVMRNCGYVIDFMYKAQKKGFTFEETDHGYFKRHKRFLELPLNELHNPRIPEAIRYSLYFTLLKLNLVHPEFHDVPFHSVDSIDVFAKGFSETHCTNYNMVSCSSFYSDEHTVEVDNLIQALCRVHRSDRKRVIINKLQICVSVSRIHSIYRLVQSLPQTNHVYIRELHFILTNGIALPTDKELPFSVFAKVPAGLLVFLSSDTHSQCDISSYRDTFRVFLLCFYRVCGIKGGLKGVTDRILSFV